MYARIRAEMSSKEPEKVAGVPGGPGGPGGPGDPTSLLLPARNTIIDHVSGDLQGLFQWFETRTYLCIQRCTGASQ